MNKKKLLLSTLILFILTSCSSNEQDEIINCLDEPTINNDFAFENQQSTLPLKEIFSNSDYKISISSYFTPDGDGINDGSTMQIENNNDELVFLASIANGSNGTSQNADLLLESAQLTISDNCEEIFSTDDIQNLFWNPGFDPGVSDGIYNLSLKLKLNNNPELEFNETIEIISLEVFTN